MSHPNSPLFDTHAHYDDSAFDGSQSLSNQDLPVRDLPVRDLPVRDLSVRDAVLSSLTVRSVRVVNAGCDIASSRASLWLAERFPFVFAACGIHPSAAESASPEALNELAELLRHPKCVALGEIGLDYHYDTPARDVQRTAFAAQLELAARARKPVVVHDREAHGDAMDMVRSFRGRGVFHCFSGSAEMARELLRRGWYIGFAGPLTYKNAARLREIAAKVPRDRALLETDAPYLPPQSRRGKRCDSSMLPETAAALGAAWGLSAEAALLQTYCNGVDFYGL